MPYLKIRQRLTLQHADFFLINAAHHNNSVFDAYAGKNLQNMNLPEFRFITHETTVQEVIAKLGEPSRRRKLSLDSVVEKQTVGAYHLNGMSIPVLEYDLPYRAAVMVMPEYPGNPNDKIRAVFYRGAQADIFNSDGRYSPPPSWK